MRSGGLDAGDRVMALWNQYCDYPDGNHTWGTGKVAYVADIGAYGGGLVADLGGGCGAGGALAASGPAAIGNRGFGLTLAGADLAATLAVVVAGTGPGTPCGACELTPPAYGYWVSGVVSGGFALPIPLPCDAGLVGAQVVWQTGALPSAGPCPLLSGFAMSNRLQTTLDW
jgi:hypothetical protein